jgi:DNA-binding LytR/AlgR family response regulator
MIKYLIIDDEHIAHGIIQRYCDMLPHMELRKNCYDAIEALDFLRTEPVDLIFLDLNMPKLKGFDFLRTLSNAPKVIVTTAYSEFALDGYELNISDYLLKPFSFERFLKAVNKAVSTEPTVQRPVANDGLQELQRIFLRSNKKYIQIVLDDILYMESAGNYVKIYTKEETITIREKITDVLLMLPQKDFLQVHKSFAIAQKHIKSIEGNRIYIATHTIPIGASYKAHISKLWK